MQEADLYIGVIYSVETILTADFMQSERELIRMGCCIDKAFWVSTKQATFFLKSIRSGCGIKKYVVVS